MTNARKRLKIKVSKAADYCDGERAAKAVLQAGGVASMHLNEALHRKSDNESRATKVQVPVVTLE